jgi:hypothetical protein
MKNPTLLLIAFLFSSMTFVSCYKEPMDYSKSINELKAQVTALQNRSDSLANALKITNSNVSNLSKTIDSIKIQLTTINTQLVQLNSQLTGINANIALITSQIATLNQQYATLLAQLNAILNQLAGGVPATLNSGLVAYFPFSGNAADSSGNLNNGTVYGAALTSDRFGKNNSAYDFNGAQYISGNASLFPSGNNPRSISIWYNARNLSEVGFSKLLFGYGGGNCGSSFLIVFENTDIGPGYIGKYEVQGHCLSFRNYTSYPNVANNQWHNIVVKYDGKVLTFYNDGNLVFTSPAVSMNTNVSSKIFNIGTHPTINGSSVYVDNLSKKFIGKIDDIRIYNRAITDAEISYLATH